MVDLVLKPGVPRFLLSAALRAWKQGALLLHERRILQGMAAAHHAKALERRVLDAWCAAAAMGRRQPKGQLQPHAARGQDENLPASFAQVAPPLQPSNSRQPSRGEAASRGSGAAVSLAAHREGSPRPAASRQLLPQHTARRPVPSTQTVVIVHHSTSSQPGPTAMQNSPQRRQQRQGGGNGHPEVQAMLRSVAEWKGTAEYWRERLRTGSSSLPSSPASAGTAAAAAGSSGRGPDQQPAAGETAIGVQLEPRRVEAYHGAGGNVQQGYFSTRVRTGSDIDPKTVQCLHTLRSQWRPS